MINFKNLEIVYTNNIPSGIRDESGYWFFFRTITKYEGQEKRYQREIEELDWLADYLLSALKKRNESI